MYEQQYLSLSLYIYIYICICTDITVQLVDHTRRRHAAEVMRAAGVALSLHILGITAEGDTSGPIDVKAAVRLHAVM